MYTMSKDIIADMMNLTILFDYSGRDNSKNAQDHSAELVGYSNKLLPSLCLLSAT